MIALPDRWSSWCLGAIPSGLGIVRRYRGHAYDVPWAISHFTRNYLMSRYGMIKTAHAIRRKGAKPVGLVVAPADGRRAPEPGFVPESFTG